MSVYLAQSQYYQDGEQFVQYYICSMHMFNALTYPPVQPTIHTPTYQKLSNHVARHLNLVCLYIPLFIQSFANPYSDHMVIHSLILSVSIHHT